MTRDDKRELIENLAPAAPPCFDYRLQWIEWVQSAEKAHRGPPSNAKPLIFSAGEPVRFNTALSFCDDCDQRHRRSMRFAGRCVPNWLLAHVVAAA